MKIAANDVERRDMFRDDLRIEHLPLPPDLRPPLADAGVDREPRGTDKAGDHAPAWARLA
jgi:exodeoxyribonuclease-3